MSEFWTAPKDMRDAVRHALQHCYGGTMSPPIEDKRAATFINELERRGFIILPVGEFEAAGPALSVTPA